MFLFELTAAFVDNLSNGSRDRAYGIFCQRLFKLARD